MLANVQHLALQEGGKLDLQGSTGPSRAQVKSIFALLAHLHDSYFLPCLCYFTQDKLQKIGCTQECYYDTPSLGPYSMGFIYPPS